MDESGMVTEPPLRRNAISAFYDALIMALQIAGLSVELLEIAMQPQSALISGRAGRTASAA
jgi:hypothetical protein